MTPTNPKRLGKYEIIDEIGSGSFGTVYKAQDTTLKRTAALKVLHVHLLYEPQFVERFQNQAGPDVSESVVQCPGSFPVVDCNRSG